MNRVLVFRMMLCLMFSAAAVMVLIERAWGDDPLERLQRLGQPDSRTPGAEQPATNDPLQRLQQLGQPDAQAGDQQPVQVPDWLVPGVRVAYRGSISTEPSANRRPDDPPEVTAAIGVHTFTVSAVAEGFVMVSAENFLQQGVDAGRLDLMSASTVFLNQMQIISGEAFFMPPQLLAQMQSGQGVEVQRGPFPLGGQQVDAVTITTRGQDVVIQQVYDAESGLKLIDRRATGPLRRGEQRNEFNRRTNEVTQFLGIRRIEGPWMEHDWPQWTAQVKQLNYDGQMIHSMEGITQTYAMRHTAKITQRGEKWVRGTSTTAMQMPEGMPPQPPMEQPFGHAQGLLGGSWISPGALAAINAGVVDRDPYTGAVLSYQTMGDSGVFTYQSTGGSRVSSAYSLADGVLQAIRFEQPQMFQTFELRLTGRE